MIVLTKENYDGSLARYNLATDIEDAVTQLHEQTVKAKQNELSFASNETVDPADFDNLIAKFNELLKAARKLIRENGDDDYGYAQQGKSFD